MKKINRILIVLQLFVGIGAVGGGIGTIINPYEPMGASTDLLKNSPFNDFFIPGIILFSIIGIGNILSAWLWGLKFKYKGYTSSIFSWALVFWIIVQCIMINQVHLLHIIYFFIGLIEVILSTVIVFEERLFPTNLILDIHKKTYVRK